jgi:Na+:H+ antiporter, NhaA family
MCAVVVIAVFYATGLAWLPLAGAVLGLALFGYLQYGRGALAGRRFTRMVQVPPAVVIWGLVHASGRAHVGGVRLAGAGGIWSSTITSASRSPC